MSGQPSQRFPRGLADVVGEVQYQQRKWGPAHDASQHRNDDALLRAAKAMLSGKGRMPKGDWRTPESLSRREQLVRAVALIIAEIDRGDRAGEFPVFRVEDSE